MWGSWGWEGLGFRAGLGWRGSLEGVSGVEGQGQVEGKSKLGELVLGSLGLGGRIGMGRRRSGPPRAGFREVEGWAGPGALKEG